METDSEVMKLKTSVLALILVVTSLLANVLDLWKNSEYHAFRIALEISPDPRMRYEEVYRWKDSKLVRVFVPVEVAWYRNEKGTWNGLRKLKRVPMKILDLEDIALREVFKVSPEITEFKWGYKVSFETSKGKFTVWLNDKGIPLRIIRRFHDIEMKMIYESWDSPPDEDKILRDYEISDELAFPESIGRALSCLDWFYFKTEDDLVKVRGMVDDRWVEFEISPVKRNGFVKIGSVYFRTDDKTIMRALMGER